jgi:hypothetical protein
MPLNIEVWDLDQRRVYQPKHAGTYTESEALDQPRVLRVACTK